MYGNTETRAMISGHRIRSVRFALTGLFFLNCLLLYAMRLNLSVAITAMVNSTNFDFAPPSNETCRHSYRLDTQTKEREVVGTGEFDWDEGQQAMVLYAFFVGYVITQIPGGYLAERYSVTWVLGLAMGFTSLLSCFTAAAARTHIYALLVLRFFEGLAEGVMLPCVYVFVSKWAPNQELGLLLNSILIGNLVGTIVTMIGSAILCDSFLGWPSSFSVFGVIGIVFSAFWIMLSADDPESHRWISPAERNFIIENRAWEKNKRPTTIPWKKILLSPAVLILGFEHLCSTLNFYFFLTELPSYLKYMFGLNIVNNGFISGGMSLGNAISSVSCGWAADKVLARGSISRNRLRKLAASVCCFVPCICLMIITQVGCRYEVILALMLLNCISMGASGAGIAAVPFDIAPNFPGIVYGIVNCFANVSGIVAPLLVGYLTNNNNTLHQWNLAFYCIAGVGVTGIVTFILFGSTERQTWNDAIIVEDEEEDHVALLNDT